jgi:hypothetical protein
MVRDPLSAAWSGLRSRVGWSDSRGAAARWQADRKTPPPGMRAAARRRM